MFNCPKCWDSYAVCKCGPDYPETKKPHGREHFESLVTELTGCVLGDGTLEVTDRQTYKNEHVQWLWKCYNFKGGR